MEKDVKPTVSRPVPKTVWKMINTEKKPVANQQTGKKSAADQQTGENSVADQQTGEKSAANNQTGVRKTEHEKKPTHGQQSAQRTMTNLMEKAEQTPSTEQLQRIQPTVKLTRVLGPEPSTKLPAVTSPPQPSPPAATKTAADATQIVSSRKSYEVRVELQRGGGARKRVSHTHTSHGVTQLRLQRGFRVAWMLLRWPQSKWPYCLNRAF